MSHSSASPATDDPRVIEALDEYVALVEVGRRPERAAFLARYSDVAVPLADCLDGFDLVQDAAAQLEPPPASEELIDATPLGDFRLLRILGRGGMGIVYEAEQLSLGRRVALKVLPFAAALDPRHLQRFKHEAQAAAHLQHPHIVPVHGVGCERGVHYYAMQFIDGRSAAQVIRELREAAGLGEEVGAVAADSKPQAILSSVSSRQEQAFFRRAARLALQAAQALDHAHQCGIIHRDIKPANLLLDLHDQLWVTDFGLAQFHGQAALTLTGDVVGTLRYMSPEQASSGQTILDHRTDIYSLGATLYELLTLRPALTGTDRQALVRQLSDAEPIPPRRFRPTLPRDLETIVLKAMAKLPGDRYSTAQEMAADLQRFLDDRPIHARRPTFPQRVGKALRRNRKPFSMAVLGLVATLTVAVIILAVSARRIADRETQVQANYAESRKQQRRAEQNFQRALDSVDRIFDQIAFSPIQPDIRRQLLRDLLYFFEAFLAETESDPSLRLEAVGAHRRCGMIRHFLGNFELSEQHLNKGLLLAESLAAEFPGEIRYLAELATHCDRSAEQYFEHPEHHVKAETIYRRALHTREQLFSADPSNGNRYLLTGTLHNFAYRLWSDERMAESDGFFRRALTEIEALVRDQPANTTYRVEWSQYLVSYSLLLRQTDRLVEAERVIRQSLEILEDVGSRLAPATDLRGERSRTLVHLSVVLRRQQRSAEAENVLKQALAERRLLVEERPGVHIRTELAMTDHSYGAWLSALGRETEAEEHLSRASREMTKVAAEFSGSPHQIALAAMTQTSLGQFMHEAGRGAEAAAALGAARTTYRDGLKRYPEDPELLGRFAWFLVTSPESTSQNVEEALQLADRAVQPGRGRPAQAWLAMGLVRYRAGDYAGAASALEKAAALRNGGDVGGFILAMATWHLGRKDDAREQLRRAVTWMNNNMPDYSEFRRFRGEAEALIGPP